MRSKLAELGRVADRLVGEAATVGIRYSVGGDRARAMLSLRIHGSARGGVHCSYHILYVPHLAVFVRI